MLFSMGYNYFILFILIFLSSCQTKSIKKYNEADLIKSICLNTVGKGRLRFNDSTHVFSFLSRFDATRLDTELSFTFPIYGTESIELTYSKKNAKFELSSSSKEKFNHLSTDFDPYLLDEFFSLLNALYQEIASSRNLIDYQHDSRIQWVKIDEKLVGKLQTSRAQSLLEFLYLNKDSFFERINLSTISLSSDESFKLEIIVRKCLK